MKYGRRDGYGARSLQLYSPPLVDIVSDDASDVDMTELVLQCHTEESQLWSQAITRLEKLYLIPLSLKQKMSPDEDYL